MFPCVWRPALCKARTALSVLLVCVCTPTLSAGQCGAGLEMNTRLVSSAAVCSPCTPGHYKNANMVRCERCPPETRALSSASTMCTPCAADSLFSVVQGLSGTAAVAGDMVVCNVCPSTRGMLQELIGQGTLEGLLEDFAAPDFFIQTASLCKSGVRINRILELSPSFTYEDDTDTTVWHNSTDPCVNAACLRSVTGTTSSTDPCTNGACLRSVTGSTPLTDACTDDACLRSVTHVSSLTHPCVDGTCLHSVTITPPDTSSCAENACLHHMTVPAPCNDATNCGKSGACSLPIPKKKGSKKSSMSSLSGKSRYDKTPTSKTSKSFVVSYDDEAHEVDVQELTPEDAKELDDLAHNKQYWMPSEHVRAPRRPTACNLATDLYDMVTIPVVDFATNVTMNVDVPVTEDLRLKMIAKKMARNALLFAKYPHLDFEAGTPQASAYSGYEDDVATYISMRAKKTSAATAEAVAESDYKKLRQSTKLQPSTKLQYQPSFFKVPPLGKSTREFADQIMPSPAPYTPLSNAAGQYEMTYDMTRDMTQSTAKLRNFAGEDLSSFVGKRPVFDVYDDLLLSRPYNDPPAGSYQNFSDSQLSLLRRDAETGFHMSSHLQAPTPHAMTDDVIDTFINITGQSVPAAIRWLPTCNGDLHRALQFFYNDIKSG